MTSTPRAYAPKKFFFLTALLALPTALVAGVSLPVRLTGAIALAVLVCVALGAAFFLSGCATVYEPCHAKKRAPADVKNLAGELRAAVVKLSEDIGERNCFHREGLDEAAAWIEKEFSGMGYAVRRLPVEVPAGAPWQCGAMTVYNLEIEKRGTTQPDEILVVGAHYDSRVGMPGWHDSWEPSAARKGTPGANDNATGIAAMLALAKMLRDVPTERSIRFVAFVNEEPPFFQTDAMGSNVYAKNLCADKSKKIVGMITPETLGNYSPEQQNKRVPFSRAVGFAKKSDYICFLSNRGSRPFVKQCSESFQKNSRIELRSVALPQLCRRIGWSDDWAFWRQGVPAFAVTDTAFLRSNDYHELSDTADKLDFETMAEVVLGLRGAIAKVAGESASDAKNL